MRSGRRVATLAAATVLAASACAAPVALGPSSTDPAPPADPPPAAAPAAAAAGTGDVALCSVLPTRVVGDLIGTGAAFAASGAGPQCTWRAAVPAPEPAGAAEAVSGGPTVQGALLDAGAYHAGRPGPQDPSVVSVDDLHGVGDEAFVVRLAEGEPTTLYVRDGQRALSLWLDDVPLTPQATERSLARMASLLLNLA